MIEEEWGRKVGVSRGAEREMACKRDIGERGKGGGREGSPPFSLPPSLPPN